MPVLTARPFVPFGALESKFQFPNEKFASSVAAGYRASGTKATGTDTDHDL